MNRLRTKTFLIAAVAVQLSLFNGIAFGDDECEEMGLALQASVGENPGHLLKLLADAIAENETCTHELVKTAVEVAGDNKSIVGEIVFTAVSVAPKNATAIVECAVAEAPKAVEEIRLALKAALTDKGASYSSGKEVYGKNPGPTESAEGFEFGRPPIDARGVYLVEPTLRPDPLSDGDDYHFGHSPTDMRGIYLVSPSSGGGVRASEQDRVRQVIQEVTITKTVRVRVPVPVPPGGGTPPGSGHPPMTPSDPVFVTQTTTETQQAQVDDPDPVIVGGSSVAGESVLPFSSSAGNRARSSGSSSSIVGSFRLNPSQIEYVRARAQKEFNRLVEEEEKELQEEVVKKTEEVEQEAEEKIVSVRQRAEVRRAQATTPQERTQIDVEVAQEIQQVEAERTVETAKVQEEVREVAIEQVRQKYGSNIAVPLETGFDTPVVAFATVDSRGIVAVAENAHELDAPPEDHSSTLDDAVLAFIEQEEYILVADTEE